jgi:hypothetical protein
MDFLLNCAPIIEAWKNSFLFSLNWLPIFLFYLAIPVQRFRNYQTTRLRPRWIVRLYRRFGYTETASFSMQCRLWGSQCNSGKIAYSTPTKEKGKFYFGMSLTFIFFSPPPSFFLLSTINNHCAPQVHHCTHNPGILFSPVCSLTIFFFFFFFWLSNSTGVHCVVLFLVLKTANPAEKIMKTEPQVTLKSECLTHG